MTVPSCAAACATSSARACSSGGGSGKTFASRPAGGQEVLAR